MSSTIPSNEGRPSNSPITLSYVSVGGFSAGSPPVLWIDSLNS